MLNFFLGVRKMWVKKVFSGGRSEIVFYHVFNSALCNVVVLVFLGHTFFLRGVGLIFFAFLNRVRLGCGGERSN